MPKTTPQNPSIKEKLLLIGLFANEIEEDNVQRCVLGQTIEDMLKPKDDDDDTIHFEALHLMKILNNMLLNESKASEIRACIAGGAA